MEARILRWTKRKEMKKWVGFFDNAWPFGASKLFPPEPSVLKMFNCMRLYMYCTYNLFPHVPSALTNLTHMSRMR
jgi:hypothetical protein